MESDISEYTLSYLDGFAFKWFEALNKWPELFLRKHFEEKFRCKFILRYSLKFPSPPYTTFNMNTYITCKQQWCPVGGVNGGE
jgi:hypothetical protein